MAYETVYDLFKDPEFIKRYVSPNKKIRNAAIDQANDEYNKMNNRIDAIMKCFDVDDGGVPNKTDTDFIKKIIRQEKWFYGWSSMEERFDAP